MDEHVNKVLEKYFELKSFDFSQEDAFDLWMPAVSGVRELKHENISNAKKSQTETLVCVCISKKTNSYCCTQDV